VVGSHPDQAAQVAAVERILRELGYGDIARLLVYNKADLLSDDELAERIDGRDALAVSATTGDGLPALLRRIDAVLAEPMAQAAVQ
jgi:GTP-binding protein HflX